MKTGHGGKSGRYNFLKELAEEYSFLMHLENIKKWFFLIKFDKKLAKF